MLADEGSHTEEKPPPRLAGVELTVQATDTAGRTAVVTHGVPLAPRAVFVGLTNESEVSQPVPSVHNLP